MEWKDPYNSFNSLKGLLYKDWYDGFISGEFKPPIEVDIDPSNNCNLKCVWCNGKDIISYDKKVMMTREHLLELVDFCADWGVKAICFAGGGEPSTHPNLSEALYRTVEKGMECSIITNGLMNDDQIKAIAKTTKWCGVSLDAGTRETYLKLKKVDVFDKVCDNLKRLASKDINELTVKFLIHPGNQHELYKACALGRDLGANCFHSRLIAKTYLSQELADKFDYKSINEQIIRCQEICQRDDYKVFNVNHKQDGKDHKRMNFDKCVCSPLLCMFEADGTTSVCIDRKGDPRTTLCRHDNVETVRSDWGSRYHKELLSKINPQKDCKKCTMTMYQELFQAYKKDKFCWRFP